MAIIIQPDECAAIYEHALDRLSGIDDVLLAASEGDWDTALRLDREFSDLQLMLSVLGRGDGTESVALELSPDHLRRTFTRIAGEAAKQREAEEAEANNAIRERADLVGRVSARILAEVALGRQ